MLANPLFLLVPGAGIEPAQPLRPRDFKYNNDFLQKGNYIRLLFDIIAFFIVC